MKAILCKDWGKPEDLVLEEVPSPTPGPGEIRLGIHAAGVNFADTLMIGGTYQVKPPLPFSPGLEVAGEVLEVGDGVTHLKPGDRVAALAGYGGFAEEVVLPAERTLPIPDQMSFPQAAAFAVAYGTSHVALTHRAQLQAGEVLLVHGAAGGVGLTAVELGKLLGATVIATASTSAKLEVAAQYGADHLINYTKEDFRTKVKELTNGKGADVIFDPVGGDVFDQSVRWYRLGRPYFGDWLCRRTNSPSSGQPDPGQKLQRGGGPLGSLRRPQSEGANRVDGSIDAVV